MRHATIYEALAQREGGSNEPVVALFRTPEGYHAGAPGNYPTNQPIAVVGMDREAAYRMAHKLAGERGSPVVFRGRLHHEGRLVTLTDLGMPGDFWVGDVSGVASYLQGTSTEETLVVDHAIHFGRRK
ncbi:MAG: hypothetical protein HY369_04395 [Candidatus Aenigmarchaeota archaeon]|nr:hypothetical protein [Candidatus Aenigmarchaeota archaeon]